MGHVFVAVAAALAVVVVCTCVCLRFYVWRSLTYVIFVTSLFHLVL